MHVAYREQELLDCIGSFSLSQSLHLNDVIVEFTTCDKLSNDVEVRIILQQLEYSNHVWMISLLEHIKLLLHQIDQNLMLTYVRLAHCFHCTCDTCLCVEALAYFTKRAFAQNAANLVLSCDVHSFFQTLEEAEL